jgi:hypothetical protein
MFIAGLPDDAIAVHGLLGDRRGSSGFNVYTDLGMK